MLQPRIEILTEKKLVGKRIRTTLSNNRTFELWQSFMPKRKEIRNSVGTDLFSLQVYDAGLDFNGFTVDTEYEKWAAAEVASFDSMPDGMEPFTLEGGLYAVFHYKGNPNDFSGTWLYIFRTWLPASDYLLDNRPHFEILGEKFKRDDPDSEEEVWIPVKSKK
jgi:AraC family transcriptional regulator